LAIPLPLLVSSSQNTPVQGGFPNDAEITTIEGGSYRTRDEYTSGATESSHSPPPRLTTVCLEVPVHNDDGTVGRILSRRQVVQLIGAGGAAAMFGAAAPWPVRAMGPQTAPAMPGCVVKPEQTEGPYFVDRQLVRSDVRVEPTTGAAKDGVPLALALTLFDVSNGQCRPLPGATVDIWHCDAQGVYSGVNDPGFNTAGQKFLRGVQTSDAAGLVRFTTIHPGWYQGRAIHIHFKIRTESAGSPWEFTSQWYFDEALNERILADPRYAKPGRRTTNATDGIFRNGGDQLLLAPAASGAGYAAAFGIGLDLTDAATGRADGAGAGGRRGRGGRRGG
jgi:protocatechuate 3,4-dioxygenase beta subunit